MTLQNGDLAPVAHTQRGHDALFKIKLDALRENEIDQLLQVLANIAAAWLGQFGKLLAFGLRDLADTLK